MIDAVEICMGERSGGIWKKPRDYSAQERFSRSFAIYYLTTNLGLSVLTSTSLAFPQSRSEVRKL